MDWSGEIRDLYERLTTSPLYAEIHEFVTSATAAEHHHAPAPGEWTIAQILRHLGDTEAVRQKRLERMLTEDVPYLVRPEPGPGERDTDDALALLARYERLRDGSLERLGQLTEAQLRRTAIQAPDPQVNRTVDEPTSVLNEAAKIERHATAHHQQIRANLAAARGGARYLDIVVGSARGRLRLLDDLAPRTCQQIAALLPIEDLTVAVKWSGNAWRSGRDYELADPLVENKPEFLKAGELAYYPRLKKLCFAYGKAQWRGPNGEIRDLSLFAVVDRGLPELVKASEQAHTGGSVVFRLSASQDA